MFTNDLWEEWSAQEAKNYVLAGGKKKYLKKGYLHFDYRFWFPQQKIALKHLLSNELRQPGQSPGTKQWHQFTPFLKILTKTPRYRYQEEEGLYVLESKIRPICFASHLDSLVF